MFRTEADGVYIAGDAASLSSSLVDAQLVPEVTHTAPGLALGVRARGQVHDHPAAVVEVARPDGQTLLSAESRLADARGGVAAVGEGAPVAQHPIGQQLLRWRQREVGDGGGVKDERELGAVTGVLVAAGQTRPHGGV